MPLREYERLTREAERGRREADRVRGALAAVLARMSEEFGCDSVEASRAGLAGMDGELARWEEELASGLDALRADFPEFFPGQS